MRGEIRNEIRIMSEEDTLALIQSTEHGVLATVNEAGQPCTATLNHVYLDGALYFHSGPGGEKLENISVNPTVSYCITGLADVIYDQFTTAFSSVVVHGDMSFVEDAEEKLRSLTALVDRFSNDVIPGQVKTDFIAQGVECVVMLKLEPEHVTGKARFSRKRPCLVY